MSEWFKDGAAAIMPWLFLALRRALIPAICCALLFFFFFGVPQSREVLHGLIQSDFVTRTSAAGSADPIFNTTALVSYMLAAWLLSLAMWYASRLLCLVMNDLSRPAAWTKYNGRWTATSVEIAQIWFPRGLGIASLGVSMGALVYANYSRSPQISDEKVLWLVSTSMFAPLVAVTSAIARFRGRLATRPAWILCIFGLVVSLGLLGVYIALSQSQKVSWVSYVATWFPAIMLLVLELRRNWIEHKPSRRLANCNGLGSRNTAFGQTTPRRIDDIDLKLSEVSGRVVAFILLGLSGLYFLAVVDANTARAFGSAAAILVFLAALILVLTGAQLVLRWLSQCVPGLTTALVLFLVVPLAYVAKKNVGFEWSDLPLVPPTAAQGPSTLNIMRTTLAARAPVGLDDASKRNVYVYAFGGGIRTAIFTAQVLALSDDASCGRFGERIAALSGVSGGSLGIATYLLVRQVLLQQKGATLWANCTPGEKPTRTPMLTAVTQALVKDHLSPAIARAVSIDLSPFSPPRRGQALLESWDNGISEAVRERPDATLPVTLQLPLKELTGGMSNPPTVYFNATDSKAGSIVWFSNKLNGHLACEFGTTPNVEHEANCGDLRVGQAVLHSSRFPIVTPTGAFSIGARSMRLVDGGYADNSGGETLRIQIGAETLKKGSLLEIDGNPPDDGLLCGGPPRDTSVPTPVEALLLSRSAHASLAAQQVRDLVPDCTDAASHGSNCTYRARLDLEKLFGVTRENRTKCSSVHDAQVPPLGWYTGSAASKLIRASVAMQVGSICKQAGLKCRVD